MTWCGLSGQRLGSVGLLHLKWMVASVTPAASDSQCGRVRPGAVGAANSAGPPCPEYSSISPQPARPGADPIPSPLHCLNSGDCCQPQAGGDRRRNRAERDSANGRRRASRHDCADGGAAGGGPGNRGLESSPTPPRLYASSRVSMRRFQAQRSSSSRA
jgi:hypothetical protein